MPGLVTPQAYTSAVLYFILSTSLLYLLFTSGKVRTGEVKKRGERVLVLGGSTGIGRSIAIRYARRGARVCIVARRSEGLEEVKKRCLALLAKRAPLPPSQTVSSSSEAAVDGSDGDEGKVEKPVRGEEVLALQGDIASVDDMVRVRQAIEDAWGGLDTLVLSAGISSLQPVLHNAGVPRHSTADATPEGLRKLQEIVRHVSEVNYVASAVVAGTFFPLLERTSKMGAVMLISSTAALIPAPTRAIYGSSKAASLLLYQALAIEHPKLAFTFILPGTVNTQFRSSAPDGESSFEQNRKKIDPDELAERAVGAVDGGERTVIWPWAHRLGHLSYWAGARRIVERAGERKYGWNEGRWRLW